MREGRLGYNSYNKRYGLLSSDLWIDPGFHCGECLEVLVDDQWVKTCTVLKLNVVKLICTSYNEAGNKLATENQRAKIIYATEIK